MMMAPLHLITDTISPLQMMLIIPTRQMVCSTRTEPRKSYPLRHNTSPIMAVET